MISTNVDIEKSLNFISWLQC